MHLGVDVRAALLHVAKQLVLPDQESEFGLLEDVLDPIERQVPSRVAGEFSLQPGNAFSLRSAKHRSLDRFSILVDDLRHYQSPRPP